MKSQLNLFNGFFTDFTNKSERFLIKSKLLLNDIKIDVTNGSKQWHFNLNQITSCCKDIKEFKEFLSEFYDILNEKSFSLIETTNAVKLEFRRKKDFERIGFFFVLNKTYEPIKDLTELCFDIYDKLKEVEKKCNENEDHQNRVDSLTSSLQKTTILSFKNKFRKPGTSIINPNTRKFKIPQGVKYEDSNDMNENDPRVVSNVVIKRKALRKRLIR